MASSNGRKPLDENTPLLAVDPLPIYEEALVSEESNGNGNGNGVLKSNGRGDAGEEENKPLPKLQIFLLCFARLIEPIAFFGIFPFLPKMIEETGNLDEEDIGFYSGFIESAFSFTQMLLMIQWGRASDRVGRKPVLVFSLTGVAIATAIFGLSKRIWQMVVFRCCAGVFAGTIVTVRTMLSENSTANTQARAFSFFAFSGNLGIFLGPLIGGVFSTPAEQWPKIFGSFQFLKDYPYALPTFITGTIGAGAAISCAILVKETLKRKDKDHPTVKPPMSTLEIIKSPGVGIVLGIYCHVMTLGLAYTAITPVFWFTSVEKGGYGFTPLQNAAFIAGIGVSQSLWLLFVFPPLQHKIGTGGVLRLCLYAWPIFFISAPVCNAFLRNGWTTAFWVVAPIVQIGGSGVAMAFTGVQLALNDIAPSQQSLGTLNAIALTMTSGIRTVGPAAFTSLFAAGAKTQFFHGYLVWVVLVLVGLLGLIPLAYLPEKAEGKLKKRGQESGDEDE
ncbi:Efflux pump [Lachnellula willkommii]|uniref:Efflux pump n=1 Tax=Lachnellula willkommii TaxID=215461 RepID=A0A559M4P6_9HELO|nr:Efflux pump [Lachnellula willkommii]